ncbi:MAG: hypothetical protein WB562_16090 [Candidatus Sulfotelmatobacter sp.]
MKFRDVTTIVSFIFLAIAAYSQDNSCAYTFTYPAAQFSLCVTVWGTLASIQSPIGVNHLDAAQPVEGWSSFILDDAGGQDGATVIPGLDTLSWTSPPTVTQPNGPGTLPLLFAYGDGENFQEAITALPYERTIALALRIRSCGDCFWSGTVSRVANIRADGNSTSNFAHSSFAAFGYVTHGVMLSVPEMGAAFGCAGTDPNGASALTYFDCSLSNNPFAGPGAVFSSWGFQSQLGEPLTMMAAYRVF